ncbi:hypothetical protein Bca4012_068107 [Brassica carinata]
MVSQTDLICHGGPSSSAKRSLDLEKEDEIIRIPACDLDVVAERFKRTLIGRVLHRGGRSIEAMISLLPRARIWNVEGRVRGINLGNGRFQFDFNKEEDLLMVLNKRPCHFNHWIFALERWEPSTSENFPSTVPFWIKVTGVPVHYWNDGTFDEIAKALGRKVALDSENARIQVSIDVDRPLQFERRVGFPNGDTGNVSLEYEGITRYCFGCKRISHDVYVCPELSQEERDQKIKEYRELNGNGTQQLKLHASNRAAAYNRNNINNKRPRSPSDDVSKRSPGLSRYPGYSRDEKRAKDSSNYWSSRSSAETRDSDKSYYRRREEHHDRYSSKNAPVWNRLEKPPLKREDAAPAYRSKNHGGAHVQETRYGRERYPSQQSQQSQRVWRPRHQENEPKSSNRIKSIAIAGNGGSISRGVTDSQQTISDVLPRQGALETQGSGVLVVHKDETPEERKRRLKGKAPMSTEFLDKTPTSAAKNPPARLLTRDRGILRINAEITHSPLERTRYDTRLDKNGTEPEVDSLDLERLMESDHIDKMVMSRKDEEEVDKLVEVFGDVVMDDEMMQNDDLLVDEPGFDAEKIDAISQLSPAYAANSDEQPEGPPITRKPADTHPDPSEYAGKDKQKTDGLARVAAGASKQANAGETPSKKRAPHSPALKGARASKKLSLPRGRPASKLPKGSGILKKTQANTVPRIEVIPSTKRMNSSSVSGSMVSQKPSSKKI